MHQEKAEDLFRILLGDEILKGKFKVSMSQEKRDQLQFRVNVVAQISNLEDVKAVVDHAKAVGAASVCFGKSQMIIR